MDNALQWKNLYPVDNATGLVRNTQLRRGGGGGKGWPTCKAGREALRVIGIKPGMALSLISPLEDTILVNSKMSAIAMWLPQTMQNY